MGGREGGCGARGGCGAPRCRSGGGGRAAASTPGWAGGGLCGGPGRPCPWGLWSCDPKAIPSRHGGSSRGSPWAVGLGFHQPFGGISVPPEHRSGSGAKRMRGWGCCWKGPIFVSPGCWWDVAQGGVSLSPSHCGIAWGCPLVQFLLALELSFFFFKSLLLPVAADAGREGMRDGKGCGKRCRKRCGMGSAARRGGRRHGPAARCHRPCPLRRPLRPLHRSHILSSAGK